MVYPEEALRNKVQGRVFVQFTVEKDGKLSNVEAIRGIGAGCDEVAVNVVSTSAAWKPGYHRGQPVRVRIVMPINFAP